MVRIFIILLLLTSCCFADTAPVTIVEWRPLSDDISMSTVVLDGTGWVTKGTVELRGRKEVNILNTSTSENVYISGVSPSSVSRTLYPRQDVTFKASSDLVIYVSTNTAIPGTANVILEFTEIR